MRNLLLLGVMAGSAIGQIAVTPIAEKDDEVVGSGGGLLTDAFSSGRPLGDGSAFLTGRTTTTFDCLLIGDGSTVSQLHCFFEPFDPVPGSWYEGTFDVVVSAAPSTVMYTARIDGGDVDDPNDSVLVYEEIGSPPQLVLREGASIPDLPGYEVSDLGSYNRMAFSINTSSEMYYRLFSPGVTNIWAIYRWTPTTGSVLHMLPGDDAPGVPGNFNVLWQPRSVNEAGQALIGANIDGGNGLWRTSESETIKVLATNDEVPGYPGVEVNTVWDTYIGFNDLGDVATSAFLKGDGVTARNDNALFLYEDGLLSTFLREGDPAPSLPGLDIGPSIDAVQLNDKGTLVFMGSLWDPNLESGVGSALWIRQDGETHLIAREDDSTPQNCGTFDAFTRFRDMVLALDESDIVVFATPVLEPGESNQAVFAWKREIGLVPIAGCGASLDIEGVVRDVYNAFIPRTNSQSSIRHSNTITEDGDVHFLVNFDDGHRGSYRVSLSGVFRQNCPGDYNLDGFADIFDLLDFLGDFATEASQTDWNDDGEFDIFDVLAFIGDLSLPCG